MSRPFCLPFGALPMADSHVIVVRAKRQAESRRDRRFANIPTRPRADPAKSAMQHDPKRPNQLFLESLMSESIKYAVSKLERARKAIQETIPLPFPLNLPQYFSGRWV